MPTLYRTVFHLPLGTAFRYQLLTNIATLCSSFVCAMLIDRTGRRAWFVAAFTGSATALLALWYTGADTAQHVLIFGDTEQYVRRHHVARGLSLHARAIPDAQPGASASASRPPGFGSPPLLDQIVGALVARGDLGPVFSCSAWSR